MNKNMNKQMRIILGSVVLLALTACGGGDNSPSISAVNPAANATDVPTNSSIFVSVSNLSSTAQAALVLTDAMGNNIPVTTTSSSEGFNFQPTTALPEGEMISAKFTDTTDNLSKSWSFTVGGAGNLTMPTVTMTVPLPAATGVNPTQPITIHFSKTMDPGSFTPATVSLTDVNGLRIDISMSMDSSNSILTIKSSAELAYNLAETLTIAGATDLEGNALPQFVLNFQTAQHGSQSWTSGQATFIVPDGVSTVQIRGYGGSGGATCSSSGSAGGVDEDAHQTVTPGESLQISVGGGGGGGSTSGLAGGASTVWVTGTHDYFIVAPGGAAVASSSTTPVVGCVFGQGGDAGSVTISW